MLQRTLIAGITALFLATGAAQAESRIPKDFQGKWCGYADVKHGFSISDMLLHPIDGFPCLDEFDFEVEITATTIDIADASYRVRRISKFDVCPYGMIFRNKKRAEALRAFQINTWSPGYHIVLQRIDNSKTVEINSRRTIESEWSMDGQRRIFSEASLNYLRCPWERTGARR
jgi:hypothetical protein